jgi:hypothetical protein
MYSKVIAITVHERSQFRACMSGTGRFPENA